MSCSGMLAGDSADPNSVLPVAPAECPTERPSDSLLPALFGIPHSRSSQCWSVQLPPLSLPLPEPASPCPHQLTSAPLARGLSTQEAANRNPLQSCRPHSMGLLPSVLGSSDPCLPICSLSPRDRSNILQYLLPLVTSVPLSPQGSTCFTRSSY